MSQSHCLVRCHKDVTSHTSFSLWRHKKNPSLYDETKQYSCTNPFAQRDALGWLAHGRLPGALFSPLHLQPTGEQVPPGHVPSALLHPGLLCVREPTCKLLTMGADPSRTEEVGLSSHVHKTLADQAITVTVYPTPPPPRFRGHLPAPEDGHYIANNLIVSVHSQVGGLGSLGYWAQSAFLQPRVGRHSKTKTRYRTLLTTTT